MISDGQLYYLSKVLKVKQQPTDEERAFKSKGSKNGTKGSAESSGCLA